MSPRLSVQQRYPAGARDVTARFLQLGSGFRVRLVESGPPDGPPVVLIPGFACSAFLFHSNLPALAAAGFRTVAVELRGHERDASPSVRADYTLPALARHVIEVLDALEIDRSALIGQSMGAAVAMRTAIAAPERVERLALIAPVGFGAVRWVRPLGALARRVPPAHPLLARRWIVAFALARIYGTLRGPDERTVDEYWAPTADRAFMHALSGCLSEVDWSPLSDADFGRIAAPVLVLWGTDDPLLSSASLEERVKRLPHGALEYIRGAGHAPNEEAPEETNRELIDFLQGVAREMARG